MSFDNDNSIDVRSLSSFFRRWQIAIRADTKCLVVPKLVHVSHFAPIEISLCVPFDRIVSGFHLSHDELDRSVTVHVVNCINEFSAEGRHNDEWDSTECSAFGRISRNDATGTENFVATTALHCIPRRIVVLGWHPATTRMRSCISNN